MDVEKFQKVLDQFSKTEAPGGKKLQKEGLIPEYKEVKQRVEAAGVHTQTSYEFANGVIIELVAVQRTLDKDSDEFQRLGAVLAILLHRKKNVTAARIEHLAVPKNATAEDVIQMLKEKNLPDEMFEVIKKTIFDAEGIEEIPKNKTFDKEKSIVDQLLGSISKH